MTSNTAPMTRFTQEQIIRFWGGAVTHYTPQTNIAEIHLTYRCNLCCVGCNRFCFLPPTTPDMTLDDARSFLRQALELKWCPVIYLIGGEPTLHKDMLDFVDIFSEASSEKIRIYSHYSDKRARRAVRQAERLGKAEGVRWARKPSGSMTHPVRDYHLAPCDLNCTRGPCHKHSGCHQEGCGISVDSMGYTVCCVGGAIDSVLGLGLRTKQLSDLFDPEFAKWQTAELCRVCGAFLGVTPDRIAQAEKVHGVWMTPTWQEAVSRIEREQHHGNQNRI